MFPPSQVAILTTMESAIKSGKIQLLLRQETLTQYRNCKGQFTMFIFSLCSAYLGVIILKNLLKVQLESQYGLLTKSQVSHKTISVIHQQNNEKRPTKIPTQNMYKYMQKIFSFIYLDTKRVKSLGKKKKLVERM